MITRSKLNQLEEKLAQINRKNDGGILWRDITEDGRLLDSNDYIMTDQEVKLIKQEDEEVKQRGYTIFCLLSYCEPKLKPKSSTTPYFVDTYKSKNKIEAVRGIDST